MPVERAVVMVVVMVVVGFLVSLMLVRGRRGASPASGRRRPLIGTAHDVRAAATAAAAQRRRGRRLMAETDAADGRGRRAGRDAHLMIARLHVVLVAASAAALHRHGPRPAPTAPQLIPVAGPGDGVQPHAVWVSLRPNTCDQQIIS